MPFDWKIRKWGEGGITEHAIPIATVILVTKPILTLAYFSWKEGVIAGCRIQMDRMRYCGEEGR